MVLMNVSEFDNVSDATDTLISAIQAFKDEDMDVGDFSMDIIDVFNQIGNSYAISTSDLADSLTRSSASLVAANNSLEQAVALTTAANTTIQNPETVGTTLKTLSMRIRGVKSELLEAGEDVDGMITNTSKLQAKVEALTNVDGKGGINILTNTGEFKSTYDILLEISKVWKQMGDMDQAALLEIIAGKRAGSVVAGILQNGDILENSYKDALGADGSAMKELNTYLDSIQGKIDQFNNSTQTMWMNFMNADVVKFFVDLATSIVKTVDDIGLLQVAVAAFFAKTAFNADSFGQFFKLDVNDVTGQIEHFGFSLKGAAKNAKGLSIGTKAAAVGVQLLNSALSMGVSLLLSWGIEAFIGWLDETIVTADELKETVEELTDSYKTAQKEFSKNLNTLTISSDSSKYKTLVDEFEELANGVNAYGENISLTSDEYERYKAICEAIVGVNPSIVEGYDSATKAIGNNAGALKQLIDLQKEQARLESAKYVSYGAYSKNKNFENMADYAINEFKDARDDVIENTPTVFTLGDLFDWNEFDLSDVSSGQESYEFAKMIMGIIGDPESVNDILDQYYRGNIFYAEEWVNDYINEIVAGRQKISDEIANIDKDYLAGNTFQSQQDFIKKATKDAGYKWNNVQKAMEAYYTDAGTFDYNAFKSEIADDASGVTYGEILDLYAKNFVDSSSSVWTEIADGYEDATKLLQRKQEGMIDTFLQVPYALREYDELSISEQSFITDWIKNSQMFKIDDSTTQDEINAAKQSIINMVRAIAGEDYKAAIKDKNGNIVNVGLDVVLDTMSNISTSSGTYAGYKKAIEENLDALWMAIEKDAAKFGFANKRDLAIQLGYEFAFEEEAEDDNTDKLVTRIAELTGESEEAIREYMDGLPPIKVTRAVEYYLNGNYDDVQGNTDDNAFTVGDAFNLPNPSGAASVDINTVQTYTALSEKASSYNDILTQTNGITADNMEVTQEYKDSLSDLGFTTEELSECFDENNDLVVKNSKRLRELVAEKKKAAAADVKLAKSQSRLEYYQLVDELNKTLNVKRDLTDAEQEAIDSTLKQLKVVEQAIYKYQLLEDSLLGATNAFEDFAQAKEVDALNTYGDSYVEMVQTMYDGIYKTGQVGTEAFWSAVEHLVPITEYAHLTEDADRMQKIISYFNKNIAPTLTLKDDAFSIDFDAVENFVEQGIANGVFNKDGATGKFNLVEGMNLEEAAKLMKMTTAQAYAFFAELDKYNVSGNEHSFLSQLDQSTDGRIMRATTELENLNKQKLALLKDGGYAEHGELLNGIDAQIEAQKNALIALGDETYKTWQQYMDTDAAIEALSKVEEKSKTLSQSEAAELGIKINETDQLTVEQALKLLEERKAKLGEPTVLSMQLAQDQIASELEQKKAELQKQFGEDFNIEARIEIKEGKYVLKDGSKHLEGYEEIQNYLELKTDENTLKLAVESGLTKTETYLSSIDSTLQSILARIDGTSGSDTGDNTDTGSESSATSGQQPGGKGGKQNLPPLPAELVPGSPEYMKKAAEIATEVAEETYNGSEAGAGNAGIYGQPYMDPASRFSTTSVDGTSGSEGYMPNGNNGKKALAIEAETVDVESAGTGIGDDNTGSKQYKPTIIDAIQEAIFGADDGVGTHTTKSGRQQGGGGGRFGDVETNDSAAFMQNLDMSALGEPKEAESITVDVELETEEALNDIAQQIQDEYKQANVDLLNRPMVNWTDMNAAGWNTPEGSYSTVDTVTFTASDFGLSGKDGHDYAINVTPILPDGTVIEGGVDGLWQYINDELSQGNQLEDLDIFLGSYDTIEAAETAAQRLHELQETYYALMSNDAMQNQDPLGLNNADANVDSLIESLKALGVEYKKTDWTLLNPSTWFDGESEIKINVTDLVTTLRSQGWTDEAIKAYCQQLSESANIEGAKIEVVGIEDIDAELDALNQQEIGDKNVDVKVTGADEAEDALNDVDQASADVTKVVTTRYVTEYQTVGSGNKLTARTPGSGGRYTAHMVNGTAHAQGTAHKGGSWGAPKTETALTGELGPELRVRGNRWELLGENGAEFNEVKKGDIIFNHKQTEELLTNGYITGRGKAFAEGTVGGAAYSGLLKPANPDSSLSNTAGTELSGAAGKLSGAAGDVSDAADDVKEVFDWIEVRLEEINERISLQSAKLENTIGASKQNAIIDDMIALNQKLYDNLTAGAAKYHAYAAKLLEKVPAEYRKAAQDGSIAIEEFTGETSKETLEAIQNYREWVQKGADATQQAEETLTEIQNLAKQAIDNISQEYENKASIPGIIIEQLEAYNALIETTQGAESAKIYEAMIKENNKQIGILADQRRQMQSELNSQVEAGNIKKYSQAWYDAVGEIAAVDTEIINLTADTEDYKDAINDIHSEHFDNLLNRLEAISDEAENLIDILSNEDLVDKDTAEWTGEGITSLGLYAQQMEVAEMQSQKYAEEIKYLNANWKKLGYTEQEYVEKLEELKNGQYDSIKAYNDTKKAIVDLTRERVDAIKEGIDKEIDAYEELINKKKEELDAEKDLYDFQKGIANQQKEIATIERKLAALSSDNSASARAKRAQLEAELAEARQGLADTYYDRSVSQKQEALDKELETFRDEKDAEKEAWDEYLEDTEKVVSDSLAIVQSNTEAVYNTLQDMGYEYSLSIAEALTSPWKAGEGAIQSYSEKFGLSMSATIQELREVASEYSKVMSDIEKSGSSHANTVNNNISGYQNAEYKKPAEQPAQAENNTASQQVVHTVKNGDTLWAIAEKYLGSGYRWREILDLNKDVIKNNTGIIYSGQKLKIPQYASGTTGTKNNQLALLDELGEELVIRPSKGRMTFMEKGTAVVPADLTANLMEWGELDPSIMLERNKPVISAPHVTNNNIEIHMEFGEVVHIDTVTNDTIPNLTKAIEKQMDKYMKNVNNNIRKYTR